MPWSRLELHKRGILYDETILQDGESPSHVERLRNSLLDVSCPLPSIRKSDDLSAILEEVLAGKHGDDQTICLGKDIQQEAIRLTSGGFSEAAWADFFHKEFFDRLETCTLPPNKTPRVSSRAHFHFDAIVKEKGQPWEIFNYLNSPRYSWTVEYCPAPDVAFFLPIYDTRSGTVPNKYTGFSSKHWVHPPEEFMVEPFTFTTLDKLNTYGNLIPGPRRICNKKTRETSPARLRCYPWLIVEFKKAGQGPETVCCQASNGAACALQLNRNVAQYADTLADQAQISPIPTVTTIGSEVTVWIAYYASDVPDNERFGWPFYMNSPGVYDDAYIMRAIWKGDMSDLHDILTFQLILENIYLWAIRIFKPLIASYLNQWKYRHLQAGPAVNPGDEADVYQEVMPIVTSLMKQYKQLELEANQHDKLVDPFRFSLILQHLVMSDHRKLLKSIDDLVSERLRNLSTQTATSINREHEAEASTGHRDTQGREQRTAGSVDQAPKRAQTETGSTYHPGDSEDEGTVVTNASETAPHRPNLRRSTRSDKSMREVDEDTDLESTPKPNDRTHDPRIPFDDDDDDDDEEEDEGEDHYGSRSGQGSDDASTSFLRLGTPVLSTNTSRVGASNTTTALGRTPNQAPLTPSSVVHDTSQIPNLSDGASTPHTPSVRVSTPLLSSTNITNASRERSSSWASSHLTPNIDFEYGDQINRSSDGRTSSLSPHHQRQHSSSTSTSSPSTFTPLGTQTGAKTSETIKSFSDALGSRGASDSQARDKQNPMTKSIAESISGSSFVVAENRTGFPKFSFTPYATSSTMNTGPTPSTLPLPAQVAAIREGISKLGVSKSDKDISGSQLRSTSTPPFGGFSQTSTTTSSGPLFGSSINFPAGGLFAPSTKQPYEPLFGSTVKPTPAGLFGSATPLQSGGFSQTNTTTSPGPLFGSSTNSSAGGSIGPSTQEPNGGLFSSTAKSAGGWRSDVGKEER